MEIFTKNQTSTFIFSWENHVFFSVCVFNRWNVDQAIYEILKDTHNLLQNNLFVFHNKFPCPQSWLYYIGFNIIKCPLYCVIRSTNFLGHRGSNHRLVSFFFKFISNFAYAYITYIMFCRNVNRFCQY